jgi:tRNA dimethylallyltransferase
MRGQGASLSQSSPTLPVITLGGPTACGKSHAAVLLCQAFGGEVINADSVAMYRGFDIGAAKPTVDERAGVPHHLLNVLGPLDDMTAGEFARRALALIAELHARGRLPVVVGGTGLYLKALAHGLAAIPPVPAGVRAELKQRLARDGLPALRLELERLDPTYAARIAPADTQRTLRALEVCLALGRPFSAFHGQATPPPGLAFLELALSRPPDELRERIGRRVLAMLQAGLVEEVRALRARGVPPGCKPMRSLGYAQVNALLDGALEPAALPEAIAGAHRQYARRQLTWFRGQGTTRALSAGDDQSLLAAVEEFLAQLDAPPRGTGFPRYNR